MLFVFIGRGETVLLLDACGKCVEETERERQEQQAGFASEFPESDNALTRVVFSQRPTTYLDHGECGKDGCVSVCVCVYR